jgi:RNA polymerase sigma-70 factor (ECF subfamily)
MIYSDDKVLNVVKYEDGKAYAWIYEACFIALSKYAGKIVKCNDSAEDMVHDLFMKLLEDREIFHITRSLKSYLYRSIRNSVILI